MDVKPLRYVRGSHVEPVVVPVYEPVLNLLAKTCSLYQLIQIKTHWFKNKLDLLSEDRVY